MAIYLVTGAAGFIGAAIAKKLLNDGNRVVTIDNLSTGTLQNIPEGCEYFIGDCQDPQIYLTIPQEQYTAIYHLAGQSSGEVSFEDPIYDLRTNTESTLLLLEFCLKINCDRFLYASTMSVYGEHEIQPVKENYLCDPKSFYGVGKLASEHYLKVYQTKGILTTSLRLFNVYGPGQNLKNFKQGMVSIFLAQAFNDGQIIVKGDGNRFRDFVYIDDVVSAFICSERSPMAVNSIINVCTSKSTTVSTLLDAIDSLFENDIQIKFQGVTPGDMHGIYGDNVKLGEILDLNVMMPLDIGLSNMLDWLKE